MSKPFDATLNAMIDLRPGQWADGFARAAGLPPGPSAPVDTDLATTLQADKVFRIDGPQPYLLHLELEANPRLGIPAELLRYNTLIAHQHDLPVETVLVLLRPKALASDMTGQFRRVGVTGTVITEFRHHVERVWERPADYWLDGGAGLAPLSLLTDEAAADLDGAVARVHNCLRRETTDETVIRSLVGSSFVLCGLRYNQERIAESYRRLSMLLEDSTTYQWILQKGERQGRTEGERQGRTEGERQGRTIGRTEGRREALLKLGALRFGPPAAAVVAALEAVTSPARFDLLTERILTAANWEDLLADE